MLRLARYAKPYLGWLLLVISLQFAQVNFDLAVPGYLAQMVNTGIQAGAGTAYILSAGISMLILTLLSGICMVAVVFIASQVAAGLAHDLRHDLFKKISSFSNAEFDRFSTASLITRSTNDITQVQQVAMMLIRIVFYAVLMSIGGILRMRGQHASLLWLIAGAVVVSFAFVIVVIRLSLPRFRMMQTLLDRLTRVARESLSGLLVVRAFNRQPFEEQRFDAVNLNLASVGLFVNRVTASMMPMMMLIMNGLSVLIVWVGAQQVAQSTMLVGDVMAAVQYASITVMSFLMLSTLIVILPRASVSSDRIADVLATEPVVHDPPQPDRFAESFKGMIEFRNVSFRYPGAEDDALRDISFTALPGQTIALIGTTGAGKSTLANLLLRAYDVTGGSILINGTDIRGVTQHDLRARIGYVPQKSSLFSGTVESNLRFADEHAGEAALRSALTTAQAAEFVLDKPEGLALAIGPGGANLSGGQKQRLAIARALVKQPPIYIFDDSFSALDFKTDATLRRALKQTTRASTQLIVTQRISTAQNADQILVLDEGRIVNRGTHADLLKTCDIYQELAVSQLGVEEPA
jgi:ATP-binding cassette, subfamily B, multidrug efflux pump